MSYFIIVEVNITNPSWINNYISNVTPMVESYEGNYIARTNKVDLLEGEGSAPQFSLIAEFPSKELALAFYNSPEYQPYKEARQSGSNSKFLLIAREDIKN